jgi:putative membrane protein
MMYFRGIGTLGRCFEGGYGYPGSYMHSGLGILMMVGTLLVAVLIIVSVIALIRRSRRNQMDESDSESLELLNERFVKGEISEEDYIKMKKVLRK